MFGFNLNKRYLLFRSKYIQVSRLSVSTPFYNNGANIRYRMCTHPRKMHNIITLYNNNILGIVINKGFTRVCFIGALINYKCTIMQEKSARV